MSHGIPTGALRPQLGARVRRIERVITGLMGALAAVPVGCVRLPGGDDETRGLIIKAGAVNGVASAGTSGTVLLTKKLGEGNEKHANVANADAIPIMHAGLLYTMTDVVPAMAQSDFRLAPSPDELDIQRFAAVAGAPNTTTQTDLEANAAAADDFYNGATLVYTDAAGITHTASVTDYASASRRITHTAWSGAGAAVTAGVLVTVTQDNIIPAVAGAPNTTTQTDLSATAVSTHNAVNIADFYNNSTLVRLDNMQSAIVTDFVAANRRVTHTAWSGGAAAVAAGVPIRVIHDNLIVKDGDMFFLTTTGGATAPADVSVFIDILELSKHNVNN